VTVPATMPNGTYHLLACADATNLVTESDETNNCTPATTLITIGP
jgi:subtilase family serine protease